MDLRLGHVLFLSMRSAAPSFEFPLQHNAFLLDDEHFDRAYEKIMSEGRGHWADLQRTRADEINNGHGGTRRLPVVSLRPRGRVMSRRGVNTRWSLRSSFLVASASVVQPSVEQAEDR